MGGTYVDFVAIKVEGDVTLLEWDYGQGFKPLAANEIHAAESFTATIRHKIDPVLATTEAYRILSNFPEIVLNPPPKSYRHGIVVSLAGMALNAWVEVDMGSGFARYDAEMGIPLASHANLRYRQCTVTRCSGIFEVTYFIEPNTAIVDHALTQTDIDALQNLATEELNQIRSGAFTRLDEAKLRVLQNPQLISDASRRSQFLAQDNAVTAQTMCTILARYLYVIARRSSLYETALPHLADFADYYLYHINMGHITTDSLGHNFNWVMNGPALVTPYLPATAAQNFFYSRGGIFPDNQSLLAKLSDIAPQVALIRDGASVSNSSHTFVAIKSGSIYASVDTWFSTWNNSTLASRFQAGARFLHIIYGY